jgi:hypothetical protein
MNIKEMLAFFAEVVDCNTHEHNPSESSESLLPDLVAELGVASSDSSKSSAAGDCDGSEGTEHEESHDSEVIDQGVFCSAHDIRVPAVVMAAMVEAMSSVSMSSTPLIILLVATVMWSLVVSTMASMTTFMMLVGEDGFDDMSSGKELPQGRTSAQGSESNHSLARAGKSSAEFGDICLGILDFLGVSGLDTVVVGDSAAAPRVLAWLGSSWLLDDLLLHDLLLWLGDWSDHDRRRLDLANEISLRVT